MLKAENILSSLCYYSVFFSPFLFPIIIYSLASGETRYHPGRSFWTHIVPYLAILIGSVVLAMNFDNHMVILITVIICAVISVYYFILNLIRGISVLIG